MASLYLPAPIRSGPTAAGGKRQGTTASSAAQPPVPAAAAAAAKPNAPSYEERCDRAAAMARLTPEQRKSQKQTKPMFVPRGLKDFDDGGAFPEIHVAQYPRHMGNPHLAKKRAGGAGAGGAGPHAADLGCAQRPGTFELCGVAA